MTTYDNLNIAETTVIFQMAGDGTADSSISSGIFDLSSLAFLPNVPLIDQIEVERIFDTGSDTKFAENIFTIADRRQMFIFPKNWYSINEQTKVLTFVNLETIPIGTDLATPIYYPLSRGYLLTVQPEGQADQFITIPVVQATDTTSIVGPNTVVRKADKVYIRRKTPSINSIVTFAPGTRLTTTQLNLQFDQLKYNIQELTSRMKNEVIFKYDENAIDGPFLGQGDLKMNGNSLKDLGSLSITTSGSQISEANSNFEFPADDFAASISTVYEAVYLGTICRAGLLGNVGSIAFTGDFTASGAKITNVANGSNTQDVATMGQISNASNLTTGTLAAARLDNASIPLEKLSASRVTYTLPSDALPTILGSATAYGSSTDSNSNNMVYLTTDLKGRISAIGHRSMSYNDLPTTTVTGATYGSGKLLTLAVNNKGIITSVSDTAISNANLPSSGVGAGTYGSSSGTAAGALARLVVNDRGIITGASSRTIEVNDLPTTSVTGAGTKGQATATNANNMLQITYDTAGRVTSASHRTMGTGDLPSSIPLSKLSGTNDGFTLPADAIGNTSIVLGKINFAAGGTIPSGNLPSIDLGNINPAVRGSFILPEAAVPVLVGAVETAYTTLPIKDFTVDAKGRVISVSQRGIGDGDIPSLSASKITSGVFDDARIPAPTTFPTAGTVGSGSNIPVITVDAKGRINTLTFATHAVSNITDYTTATDARIDARAISHAGGAFYNAGTKKISNVVDPAAAQDAATKNYVDTNYTLNTGLNAVIDSRLSTNSVFLTGGVLSAGTKKISNVVDPASDQDVVTRKYLTDNSIALISGNYSVGSKPIIGLTMRAAGTLAETDAVNFGFIQSLVLTPNTTLLGSTTPQIYRDAWSALSKTSGHLTGFDRYQRTFTDLGAVNSNLLLLGADAVTKTFVPYLVDAVVGTAHDGYFWLDVGGANKVLNVYVTTGATPSGNILTRNFGLSRLVSGAAATTSAQGIVSILAGNEGGINVNAGELSLKQATASQIGGIKQGTGLSISSGVASVVFPIAGTVTLGQVMVAAVGTSGLSLDTGTGALSLPTATSSQLGGIKIGTGLSIASGVVSVKLTDLTSLTDSTTAASATAVKAAYTYTTDQIGATNSTVSSLSSTVTSVQNTANAALPKAGGSMTGPLALASGTNIPLKFTAATPTSPTDGSVWYESNTLKMQTASGAKTVAFTDSSLTGSAASANKWTAGMTLTLGGDLGGNVTFDGATGVTLTATIANNSVALGTDTTGNYVATVAAGDGITVSGSGSETAAVTVTNSDRGSLQNIYKTIVAGGTTITADSNASSITITGSNGITVTGNNTTKAFDIASSITLPNSFSTITVAGQPNVVADVSADTLNLAVGSGITISTTDNPESLTFNNTGVLSIAGSSNQITASTATGAVSLTLPQSIGTSNDVQFGSAILNTVRISKVANTIDTTSGNLILAPITAATTVTGSLGVSTTFSVTSTSLFSGAVTLSSTLALSAAAATITLGGTLTSINRASSATGVNQIGDIILRTPAIGKVYLVANDTNTTLTTANDAIVTKGVMDTAISTAGNAYISTAGAIRASGSQTFGSTDNSFIVSNGGVARLTIANNGSTTLANALTISTGGLNIVAGGLTVAGTTSITGAVTINNTVGQTNGLITASQAPSSGSHLTNKDYVDGAINSISDTDARLPIKKLLMQVPIRQYEIAALVNAAAVTLTTVGMVLNVPKYFPVYHVSGNPRSTSITVAEGHQIIILHQVSSASSMTSAFAYTPSVLFADESPVATMLSYRSGNVISSTGTFTRVSIGSVLTGGVGGTTFVLGSANLGSAASVDYILMRIA